MRFDTQHKHLEVPCKEGPLPRKVLLKPVLGDLIRTEADALVNSANTAMHLGGSASVAGAIDRATCGRLQAELLDEQTYPKPAPIGAIYVTAGDVLPVRHVLHLATHGTHEEMQEWMQENLKSELLIREDRWEQMQSAVLQIIGDAVGDLVDAAEELECQTLSLPLLGTGSLGIFRPLAAEVLVGGLIQRVERGVDSLHTIFLVSPEPETFHYLVQVLSSQAKRLLEPEELDASKLELLKLELEADWMHNTILKLEDVESVEELFGARNFSSEKPVTSSARFSLPPSKPTAPEALTEISRLRQQLKQAEAERDTLKTRNETLLSEVAELQEKLKVLGRPTQEGWTSNHFPAPLAYAYDLALAGNDPIARMQALIAAVGVLVRTLGTWVCAEYQQAGCPSSRLNRVLYDRFRNSPLTYGDFRWMQYSIAEQMQQHGVQGRVLRELPAVWMDQGEPSMMHSLKRIIRIRNDMAHLEVLTDADLAQQKLEEAFPIWEDLLDRLIAFQNYELLFLEGIQNFAGEDRFIYNVRFLQGRSLVPPGGQLELKGQLALHQVYLRHQKHPEQLLSLYPFFRFELCGVTNTRELYCMDHSGGQQQRFAALRFPERKYFDSERIF